MQYIFVTGVLSIILGMVLAGIGISKIGTLNSVKITNRFRISLLFLILGIVLVLAGTMFVPN